MDIFHFFKKKSVLLRCTECYSELELSLKEIRLLEKLNANDPICPIMEFCHFCHVGFLIPVKYVDKNGKDYLFHKIKPQIKNLDHNTLMERIFEHTDPEYIFFFGPDA